jgi:DNA-binding XRE family transcriptional regulator
MEPSRAPPFESDGIDSLNKVLWIPNKDDQYEVDQFRTGMFYAKCLSKEVDVTTLSLNVPPNVQECNVLSRTIQFYPTKAQKHILRNAEQSSRWTYNVTTNIVANKIQPFHSTSQYDNFIQKFNKTYQDKHESFSTKILEQKFVKIQETIAENQLTIEKHRDDFVRLEQKQDWLTLTKKDFAKEIGVKRKAIDRIEKFVDKKQKLAQDSAIQPYQPKIDFSSHFQAIRNFIVTRKGNPFFDGSALPDDAIEWSKEKKTWLYNNPNLRQLLIDCHKDIRAQAVQDAIGNWNSQQTNQIRGFQGSNGKTPYKRFRDLYSNGFMVPIPKPAISWKRSNVGRLHMRFFNRCYSEFGLISLGRMHDQVIRWFKGTFPNPSTYQNILVKFNVKTNEYFLCTPYANQLTNC